MSQPESISLAYNDLAQGGNSDKVYHASLTALPGVWTVAIQYGRRGSALTAQTKLTDPSYEKAKKLFDKVVREKKGKGYIEEGAAPAPQVAPSGAPADIKPPELLEEIQNGAHLAFLADPNYWMQDKSDGVSRGVLKQNGEFFGINKSGLPVPLPADLVAELREIPLDTFQIDAELVGPKLVCRDLLVADHDISAYPYYQRFALLQGVACPRLSCKAAVRAFKLVSVVETWRGMEKSEAIARSLAERREGVVFKLTTAPYRAGRNGQHKKFKFIKTLSAIAGPKKEDKESVEVFLKPHSDFVDKPAELVRCGTVSLIGKPPVKEGDVIEVAYLYAMPSGLMVQARMLSVRDDVAPTECTTSQLIFKREEAE